MNSPHLYWLNSIYWLVALDNKPSNLLAIEIQLSRQHHPYFWNNLLLLRIEPQHLYYELRNNLYLLLFFIWGQFHLTKSSAGFEPKPQNLVVFNIIYSKSDRKIKMPLNLNILIKMNKCLNFYQNTSKIKLNFYSLISLRPIIAVIFYLREHHLSRFIGLIGLVLFC